MTVENNTKIKDLVEVPRVKTVIQMADLEDPELREFITSSFLLTDEVEDILNSFFADVTRPRGRGYFIEGNFGSGKSHLLGVMSLLFKEREAWGPILAQAGSKSPLAESASTVKNSNYIVINISLVEHSHKEYLEDIVISSLAEFFQEDSGSGKAEGGEDDFVFAGEEDFIDRMEDLIREEHPDRLKSFLRENDLSAGELFQPGNLYLLEKLLKRLNLPYRFNFDRGDIFSQLESILQAGEYQGAAILIDELSEFLRSKQDGRRFNEDIRFLQYLGEKTEHLPCWVVATLQEEIEKTGETTPEAFNKIKDRFPTRFRLSGAHIKEIVSRRLIRLKEGAGDEVEEIHDHFSSAFPDLPFSGEEFKDLYPVHPRAVELLDNLKPLFSQHRGIIDFIHHQLRGDSSRGIEGMMEEPARTLLTADRIFDHFLPRLREMMETSPYHEKVYKYYEQEMGSLLSAEEAETGMRIIKLLILFKISPVDKDYTVKDIASMLLKRITDLDPRANYEYIADILERLYSQGAYLAREEGDSPPEHIYRVDLEADVNLIIRRKKEYIKSNLFDDDSRIFTRPARDLDDKVLPLKQLFASPKSRRTVSWHNTEREGFLYFLPLTDISLEDIGNSARRLLEDEEDFMFIIGHAHSVDDQRRHLQEVLLPELDAESRKAFLFWLPAELEEKDFLQDALARLLLLDQYEDDTSPAGRDVREMLGERIEDDRPEIKRILRQAYYQGEIIDGREQEIFSLESSSYLPFDRLMQLSVSALLENRFPQHAGIAPLRRVLRREQIDELIEEFLRPGEIDNLGEAHGNVLNVIDTYLKPMGLIKKTKNSIALEVNPDKNPLLQEFFACLEDERTPLDEVYLELRRGDYGLTEKQFQLLVYCLLFAGYITAFSEHRKISLSRLNARNFNRIEYLGYGEIIDDEFQEVLRDCSLLPPRFKDQPFSLPLQHDIWEHVREEKRDLKERLEKLKTELERLPGEEAEIFNREKLDSQLESIETLLDEIKVSYSSQEGLERFASQYRSMPYIDSYLERMEQVEQFFQEIISDYRRVKRYLQDEGLEIPGTEEYEELHRDHQQLLEALNQEELVYREDYFPEIEEKFEDFRRRYVERYRSEHERQLSGDRFKPYRKVRESRGYRVLKQLADIEIISVSDDLVRVDRMLSRALRQRCQDFSLQDLQQRPVCSCGFQLGQEVELTSLEKIQKSINSGVIQYLESIQSEEHREKLEDYVKNMEAAGEKRFARPLRELLKLDTEKRQEILDKLEENLNRRVIKRINQALSEDVAVVERNLDELYENLVGRSFSPEQIRNILQQWLEGDRGLEDRTYIKVTSSDTAVESSGESRDNRFAEMDLDEKLENYLEGYYPELLPLLDDAGGRGFLLLIAISHWQQVHGLSRTQARELAGQFLPRRQEEIASRLEEESSLTQALKELTEEAFIIHGDRRRTQYALEESEREEKDKVFLPAAVKDYVERLIREENLGSFLLQKLSADTPDEWLDVLKSERISLEFSKLVARQLIQKLEGGASQKQVQYCRRSLKDIRERKDSGQKSSRQPEGKEDILNLVESFMELSLALRHPTGEEPENAAEWKELYREHLGGLEYHLFRALRLAKDLELASLLPVFVKQDDVERHLRKFTNRFDNFYKTRNFIRGENEAKSSDKARFYDLRHLINVRFPRLLKKMRLQGSLCLLMDGMRLDIWRLIKERLKEKFSCRILEEGQLFALNPASTERQLEALRESSFSGEIYKAGDFNWSEVQGDELRDPKKPRVIRFSYIDDRVHTSKDEYPDFIDEIMFQTENRLFPFLKNVPSEHPLLFFADHGFSINHDFKEEEKYETPRYLHGSGSLNEVIVPWSLVYLY